ACPEKQAFSLSSNQSLDSGMADSAMLGLVCLEHGLLSMGLFSARKAWTSSILAWKERCSDSFS
ncbi:MULTISPECIES: hypothetical protein, partial [unclassified Pseudomonas]|uniref:hypothetical protein n=1 Tax=unclassified Pseudomonas TaxID=196821 RepID=UPI001C46477F